jgi:uncharacterized protein (TIGR00251 family)
MRIETGVRQPHPATQATQPPLAGTGDLRLDESREGVRLRLRAVPGARRDAILGVHGDALRVAVRAIAERGRANAALVALVAEALAVRTGDVEVVAGASGRDKTVLVRGLSACAVRERLAAALGAER